MANRAIPVGVMAGVAAGLLVVATVNAGPFAFFLMFIATGAIYVAGLGWGRDSAIASVAASTGTLAAMVNLPVAMGASALLFIPAAWVSYLANLGHARPGGGIDWYPLGRILMNLMAVLAAAFLIVGYAGGINEELLARSFRELFNELAATQPDFGFTPEMIESQARVYADLVPLVAPAMWLLMHVITAFASASITRRSGLLPRQRDDVASNSNLPVETAAMLAAGLVLMMLFDGNAGLLGAVLLGLSISGFAISGLGWMHLKLRGNPAAVLILVIAYGAIITIGLPILVFTVLGLFRAFQPNNPKPPARI